MPSLYYTYIDKNHVRLPTNWQCTHTHISTLLIDAVESWVLCCLKFKRSHVHVHSYSITSARDSRNPHMFGKLMSIDFWVNLKLSQWPQFPYIPYASSITTHHHYNDIIMENIACQHECALMIKCVWVVTIDSALDILEMELRSVRSPALMHRMRGGADGRTNGWQNGRWQIYNILENVESISRSTFMICQINVRALDFNHDSNNGIDNFVTIARVCVCICLLQTIESTI